MRRTLVVGLALPLALAACSGGGGDTVTLLAASSLADVMPTLIDLAHQQHPDDSFEVSYAASSQIVQQLNAGVDADVAVLAGEAPLDVLDTSASEPTIVATNSLTVALAPGNPARISSLDDLAGGGVTLVLCAEQVPCGEAAAQMLALAGVDPSVASYEPDVRATLAKVASGEADAGVVYVTDVTRGVGRDVETLPVPAAVQVINRYPAFSLDDSSDGEDFVALLETDEAQGALRAAGFGPP
ncbi:MAG: molybdate ABC transporter substrate-binding protein [Ornithinimicrobium sp.]